MLASPPAADSRSAACSAGSSGVTVVVDFGNLPGGVQIRCVTEPVATGFDALEKAGFSWTGTQRYPGLLCRIDGKPADAACVNAPPSDRYWAYWTADGPGESWTYSDVGAGNRTPPPGSVEGWAFSDGCTRAPQGPPCPTPTTTTTRPPATPTTTGGSAGAPAGPSGNTATTAAAEGLSAPGRASTSTTADGATATSEEPDGGAAPEPGAEGDEADEREQVLPPVDPDRRGGGPAGGALVGVGLAGAIGAGALVVARRRRSAEGHPA